MQRLMRETIKPTDKYKKAVVAMEAINLDDTVANFHINYGHSPYAFDRIELYLKYNERMVAKVKKRGSDVLVEKTKGMAIDGIIEYLANDKDKDVAVSVHKNSWIRWATPNHKYQSSNIYYETWVLVRDALNSLLARTNRSIADFTHVPTYSPENLKNLRGALGLTSSEFAEIVGLANDKAVELVENLDPAINTRGMGYEDWLLVLDRIRSALQLKNKHGDSYLTYKEDSDKKSKKNEKETELT